MEPGCLGRSPATLTGDNLVAVRLHAAGPDQDRLQDTLGADRVGQVLEILFGEAMTRLVGVGLEQRDRQVPDSARRWAL